MTKSKITEWEDRLYALEEKKEKNDIGYADYQRQKKQIMSQKPITVGGKIILTISFVIVAILVVSLLGSSGASEERNKAVNEALRKCTVMEAADIYTTGVGKKSNNAFNDAKDTCNDFMWSWGDDELIEAVEVDWTTRQGETIEGQPLTYYLNTLGW